MIEQGILKYKMNAKNKSKSKQPLGQYNSISTLKPKSTVCKSPLLSANSPTYKS